MLITVFAVAVLALATVGAVLFATGFFASEQTPPSKVSPTKTAVTETPETHNPNVAPKHQVGLLVHWDHAANEEGATPSLGPLDDYELDALVDLLQARLERADITGFELEPDPGSHILALPRDNALSAEEFEEEAAALIEEITRPVDLEIRRVLDHDHCDEDESTDAELLSDGEIAVCYPERLTKYRLGPPETPTIALDSVTSELFVPATGDEESEQAEADSDQGEQAAEETLSVPWIVRINIAAQSTEQFAAFTRELIDGPAPTDLLAFVADGQLLTIVALNTEITDGTFDLAGTFTEAEAKELATAFRVSAGFLDVNPSVYTNIN